MSGLGDRLLADCTVGGERPLGSWLEQAAELIRAYGSLRRTAARTPFSRSTFYRWSRGAKPRVATLARLAQAVRETRVNPLHPTDSTIVLEVTERRPGRRDGTQRTITARQMHVRAGTMARVIEAYTRTGDPEVMARVFVAGVGNGFYRNWLAAGLDAEPAGPQDVPSDAADDDEDGDGYDDEDEAIYDLYDDYDAPDDSDLMYEGAEDPGTDYAFDVE